MDTRQTIPTAVTIQLDNPIHGTQFAGAVLMSSVRVVTNNGQIVYQQAGQVTEPAIASDLTPEMVAQINQRLQRLGYQLTPVQPAAEAE